MLVIGMDISKGIATCVMLNQLPSNLQEYSRSKEFVWWHIEPKTQDLAAIAALEPDLICFEPSGGKYERAFQHYSEQQQIKFLKVSGCRLKTYREDNRLPKNDHFDALAIAAYGLEKYDESGAFIPQTPPQIDALRRLVLQRFSLNRIRTGHYCRLRLQLAGEFPEAMDFAVSTTWQRDIPQILLWLNGESGGKGVTKWRNAYEGARVKRKQGMVDVPPTCGTGISEYTRWIAKQLLETERAIARTEEQIEIELKRPEYQPYVEAMQDLGMPYSLISCWLTRIYPFAKFLDEKGRERKSKKLSNKGKQVTRNHSLAQFKAALGAAIEIKGSGTNKGIAPTKSRHWQPTKKSSGESEKTPLGCKHSRVVFWQWVSTQIETGKAKGSQAKKLIDRRNALKKKGRNIFQCSGNLHGFAAKLIYQSLKKSLVVN
jgi:hypothetical protein